MQIYVKKKKKITYIWLTSSKYNVVSIVNSPNIYIKKKNKKKKHL